MSKTKEQKLLPCDDCCVLARNRRQHSTAEWTKEPPTEAGCYFVHAKNPEHGEVIVVDVFSMNGILHLKGFSSKYLKLQGYCNAHPEAHWQKINVPALPEEGVEK